jgi:hypothetical protein
MTAVRIPGFCSAVHWKKSAARQGSSSVIPQVSRTTSAGFLSSRMATNVQCRKCPASVHSPNATWQTSFGLTQRHCSIFSAVSDSPHREAPFSGRFLNGQRTTLSLESREDFVSISRHEAVLYLRHEDELFVFVNAHEQGIETERTGNATANDELLLSIRAVVDRRS